MRCLPRKAAVGEHALAGMYLQPTREHWWMDVDPHHEVPTLNALDTLGRRLRVTSEEMHT